MLGKFDNGSITSYIARAGNTHTYFDMGNKWDEALEIVAGDLEEMWEINKRFLLIQKEAGKEFYFSHDPAAATGFMLKEVNFIRNDLKATTFTKVNNNTWKAIW